jgi:hypothetical protein
MQGIATAILIVFFALLPAAAAAEERVGSIVPTARQLARQLATESIPVSARQAQAQSVRRDSLKNGAIIGLIIGAASMGTFAWLLYLSDPACDCATQTVLGFAALGGGIGAGIGVGVDALFDRRARPTVRPGVRLAITF